MALEEELCGRRRSLLPEPEEEVWEDSCCLLWPIPLLLLGEGYGLLAAGEVSGPVGRVAASRAGSGSRECVVRPGGPESRGLYIYLQCADLGSASSSASHAFAHGCTRSTSLRQPGPPTSPRGAGGRMVSPDEMRCGDQSESR